MGSSSKSQTTGWRYYMGLMMAFCYGPVDKVHKLIAGERDAWVGDVDESSSIEIDAADLFGGDSREGGLKGKAELMFGEATQVLSGWARALLPAPHVGYRGVLTMLYDGLVAANNPYIKPIALQLERVLAGWDGDDPWYPETARIPLAEGPGTIDVDVLGAGDASTTSAVGQTVTGLDSTKRYRVTAPDGRTFKAYSGWASDTSAGIPAGGPWSHRLMVTKGPGPAVGQSDPRSTQYSNLASSPNDFPTAQQAWEAFVPFDLTGATEYTFWIYDPNPNDNRGGLSLSIAAVGPYNAMNPAHIIVQAITDPEWGDGWPVSMIGASFTAAADRLYAESFGMCLPWNRQGDVWDFVGTICDHIGGIVYNDPRTGLFELQLLRGGYDVESLPLFETDDDAVERFQRAGYGAMVNEITVVYRDWQTNTDGSVTVQNLACVQAQGGVLSDTRQYPGLPTAELAARVAQRDVLASSTPLARATLVLNRSAWALVPGSVIRWRWAREGIESVPFRVLDVDRGELADGAMRVVIAEDIFGLPDASYIKPEPVAWQEPDRLPSAITRQALVEVPYRTLVSELSTADLAALDEDAAYFAALAGRPSALALNFELWSLDGSDYRRYGRGSFVPTASLATALAPQATLLHIADGIDLGAVEVGSLAVVGSGRTAEWVLVQAVDLAAMTVQVARGMLDTTPGQHAAETQVWFGDGTSASDRVERATGEEVSTKLLTVATGGVLPIEDAVAVEETAEQRQYRPYAPGNVRLNGETFPELMAGSVTCTWAHRDRLQQTAGFVAQSAGSIGPEPGVTYSARLVDEQTEDLVWSVTGVTGTSASFDLSGQIMARFELWAVRGGLESWQRQVRRFASADSVLLVEDGDYLLTEGGEFLLPDPDVGEGPVLALVDAQFVGVVAGRLLLSVYGSQDFYLSEDDGQTFRYISSQLVHYISAGQFAALDAGAWMSLGRSTDVWQGQVLGDVTDLPASIVESINDTNPATFEVWYEHGFPRTSSGEVIEYWALASDGSDYWVVGNYAAGTVDRRMWRAGMDGEFTELGVLTEMPDDPNATPDSPTSWANLDSLQSTGRLKRIGTTWWLIGRWAAYWTDDADGVEGWRRAPTGFEVGMSSVEELRILDVLQSGSTLVALRGDMPGAGGILSISTDGGETWTVSLPSPFSSGTELRLYALLGSELCVYGVVSGKVIKATAPFATWTEHDIEGLPVGQYVSECLAVGGRIVILTDAFALLHSTDGVHFSASTLDEEP